MGKVEKSTVTRSHGDTGKPQGAFIKAGWKIKTLGDIADVRGGKRVPKGYKLQLEPTEHPYITVSDFSDDGTIDTSNLRYISSEIYKQIKQYTISSNDLYLSIAGTIGKTGYVPFELDGSNLTENACKLVLRPNIDRDFVYYFTQSDHFIRQAQTNTRTAAQPKLALERLKTIKLTIPESLPEQQRIVAVLDEAFAGIATAKTNAEKNLQNARAIFENHLQSVFTKRDAGWRDTTIGDQFILQRGFDITKDEQDKGDVPVVSSGGIKSFHNKAMVHAPGVVIGRKGTLGKVFYLEADFWPHDTTLWVKDFKGNNPRFVYYFLLGLDVKGMDTGTANPALNRNQVHPIKVIWPSISKQEAIVVTLDSLHAETRRLESIYQQKLAALDELKKSLLDQAFSGKL
jgi:type I restriction enzyme S subunit